MNGRDINVELPPNITTVVKKIFSENNQTEHHTRITEQDITKFSFLEDYTLTPTINIYQFIENNHDKWPFLNQIIGKTNLIPTTTEQITHQSPDKNNVYLCFLDSEIHCKLLGYDNNPEEIYIANEEIPPRDYVLLKKMADLPTDIKNKFLLLVFSKKALPGESIEGQIYRELNKPMHYLQVTTSKDTLLAEITYFSFWQLFIGVKYQNKQFTNDFSSNDIAIMQKAITENNPEIFINHLKMIDYFEKLDFTSKNRVFEAITDMFDTETNSEETCRLLDAHNIICMYYLGDYNGQQITDKDKYDVTERNRFWCDQNQNPNSIMHYHEIPDKTSLIAVGAAHLPGEHGLLSLLKKQGFKVEAFDRNLGRFPSAFDQQITPLASIKLTSNTTQQSIDTATKDLLPKASVS